MGQACEPIKRVKSLEGTLAHLVPVAVARRRSRIFQIDKCSYLRAFQTPFLDKKTALSDTKTACVQILSGGVFVLLSSIHTARADFL